MERTSTGGTRREAQFRRAASRAMSGAERAEKKRTKACLFTQKRQADLDRIRKYDKELKRNKVAAAKKAGVGVGHDPIRANKRLPLRAHQPKK